MLLFGPRTLKILFSFALIGFSPARAETLVSVLSEGLRATSCECLNKPSTHPQLRSCGTALGLVRFARPSTVSGTWTYVSPFGAMGTDLARPIWFYSETKETPKLTIETISSARATKEVVLNRREVIERHPGGFVTKATQHLEIKSKGDRAYEFIFEKASVREKDGRNVTVITEKLVCQLRPN